MTQRIDPATVPRSVAVIMDGNGRWARNRGLPRHAGHRVGAKAVDRLTQAAVRAGVEHLVLYAFSTENWNRPKREVDLLWQLLVRYLSSKRDECLREGIRIRAVGRRDRMPRRALRTLQKVEAETSHCERMTLSLALDYGGLWDLQHLVEEVRKGEREGRFGDGPLEAADLHALLGSSHVPPVDLLIRPGGESRVSNFLPVQLSYAELLFIDKLWPDFDEQDFEAACHAFGQRQRRFGKVPASKPEPSSTLEPAS